MGMPKIEKQDPLEVSRKDSINLLLASIGFEELGLSHILNAEAEKIQLVVKNYHNCCSNIGDLLRINSAVNDILKTIATKEIILNYKLDNVIELIKLELLSSKRKHDCDCKHDCDRKHDWDCKHDEDDEDDEDYE